jgi:hypothetical protein
MHVNVVVGGERPHPEDVPAVAWHVELDCVEALIGRRLPVGGVATPDGEAGDDQRRGLGHAADRTRPTPTYVRMCAIRKEQVCPRAR